MSYYVLDRKAKGKGVDRRGQLAGPPGRADTRHIENIERIFSEFPGAGE